MWEAKRDATAEDEPIEDLPPLELETEVAIAEVVRSVNRKLGLPAGPERSAAEGQFSAIDNNRCIDLSQC